MKEEKDKYGKYTEISNGFGLTDIPCSRQLWEPTMENNPIQPNGFGLTVIPYPLQLWGYVTGSNLSQNRDDFTGFRLVRKKQT